MILTLKSTSGYVFLAPGGANTWKSKKQTTRALSSTEAEYIAISEAGHEIYGSEPYSKKSDILNYSQQYYGVTITAHF